MVSKEGQEKKTAEEPSGETGGLSCYHCGMKVDTPTKYCPRCGWLLKPPEEEPAPPRDIKKSLLLLGRDVGVAILVVLIVLGGIFAYTRVWPPMVVIESSSMQHRNDVSYISVIDTGDLVLVQAAPQRSDVITWVQGKATGYMTYSNYGDVIIFNRADDPTPVIHRPIFWMNYNATTRSFDIPDLAGPKLNALWGGRNANGSAATSPYGLNGTIWLAQSGWRGNLNLTFDLATSFLSQPSKRHEGYVTLGDNNAYGGSPHPYDDTPVLQKDVLGIARGELPWFGLLKLTLAPSQGHCCRGWGDISAPKNSWDSLLTALLLIIVTPILIDISTTLLAKRKKKAGDEEEPRFDTPPEKDKERGGSAEKSDSLDDVATNDGGEDGPRGGGENE